MRVVLLVNIIVMILLNMIIWLNVWLAIAEKEEFQKQAIEYGYAKYDSSKEFKWIKPLSNGETK